MVCGKFPKVQCQVPGAYAKVVLLTLSFFKEFEFGDGDGTIPQSHRPRSKQTLGEVRRPKQK